MNANIYVKILPIKGFRPDEDLEIIVEYADALAANNMTLTVDGYYLIQNGHKYEGTTITQFANTAIGSVYRETFVIPANTLGESVTGNFTWGGKPTAQVEIANVKSNIITLPMILDIAPQLKITPELHGSYPNNVINCNSSIQRFWIEQSKSFCIGNKALGELESYQVHLYNAQMKEIFNSGVITNWNSTADYANQYKLRNLKDDTTYYIKVTGLLVGELEVTSTVYTLNVNYTDIPTTGDDELVLNNSALSGYISVFCDKNNIPNNATKCIISKTITSDNEWCDIRTIENISDIDINVFDYYCLQDTQYRYRASFYNDNTYLSDYQNSITSHYECTVVADSTGGYAAVADMNILPLVKNFDGQIQKPLDNKYPIFVSNSKLNYYSATVSGLFAKVNNNCDIDMDSITGIKLDILEFLGNKKNKVIKSYSFGAYIGTIMPNPQIEDNDDDELADVSFSFAEIADITDTDNFKKYGLI